MTIFSKSLVFLISISLFNLAGCTKQTQPTSDLSGTVKIDGSSTVFPVSEAMAEEFGVLHRNVRVTVGVSGTGGGFKKFLRGEIDISDASRRIKASEAKIAEDTGIQYMEIPVAYDGISVVVNPRNTFAKQLSVAQLRELWSQGSKIKTWKDLNPAWPDKVIKLYGPGPDSGTFDYFNEAVIGKNNNPRADYVASEDDNVIVKGVAGDDYALGYFGYAYFVENQDKLNAVAVQGIDPKVTTAVLPNDKSIADSSYPLSRPIFIYVSQNSSAKKEVHEFVRFYLNNATDLVPATGYIPLQTEKYQSQLKQFEAWAKKTEITMN